MEKHRLDSINNEVNQSTNELCGVCNLVTTRNGKTENNTTVTPISIMNNKIQQQKIKIT